MRRLLGDEGSDGVLLEAAAVVTTLDEDVAVHTPGGGPGVLDDPVGHLLAEDVALNTVTDDEDTVVELGAAGEVPEGGDEEEGEGG